MMIHPEQVKLLYHGDYRYFVRAYAPHPGHDGLFVFGCTLRIEEYLAKELQADLPIELAHAVRKYFTGAANYCVPAYTHSILNPEGAYNRLESVSNAWPISSDVFTAAGVCNWDLRHPEAPIDAIEYTIHQMKEATGKTT